MKRAAAALNSSIAAIAAGFGLEGAFLLLGTVCLAIGGSFIGPAVPWFVIGGMAVFAGIALALPRKS